jgi:L-alanine-DL-glutamate epimerase-like enolase superfamily enzyme
LEIHSIEQPLKKGQWEQMKILCRNTPVPVGLDEELIGAYTFSQKKELVEIIQPQYLILKPSLIGGFTATADWIKIAESYGIGWWITSALESNIGLNAICQFTYAQGVKTEQGLGTGKLFENNIGSPLEVTGGSIRYKKSGNWDLSPLGIDDI